MSGKMQTWYNCRGQGITNFIVALHPEGRECVAVLQARRAKQADREAIEHVLDTFKVDCDEIAKAEVLDRGLAEVVRVNDAG